jgi:hypothetical protein
MLYEPGDVDTHRLRRAKIFHSVPSPCWTSRCAVRRCLLCR